MRKIMAYNDEELTVEELNEVKAGIVQGHTEEMLNKLSKSELSQLKETYEKELDLEELDKVKAGMPVEMVEEVKEQHQDLYRK